jgi:hypothetical protein
MAAEQDFDASLARVKDLVDLCSQRLEAGSREWLLDYNLPDLYFAIGSLYVALGEPERLQRAELATRLGLVGEVAGDATVDSTIEPQLDASMQRRLFRTGSGEVISLPNETLRALSELHRDGTLSEVFRAIEDEDDRLIRESEGAFAALLEEPEPSITDSPVQQ